MRVSGLRDQVRIYFSCSVYSDGCSTFRKEFLNQVNVPFIEAVARSHTRNELKCDLTAAVVQHAWSLATFALDRFDVTVAALLNEFAWVRV